MSYGDVGTHPRSPINRLTVHKEEGQALRLAMYFSTKPIFFLVIHLDNPAQATVGRLIRRFRADQEDRPGIVPGGVFNFGARLAPWRGCPLRHTDIPVPIDVSR